MTGGTDCGLIRISFWGPETALAALRDLVSATDRLNGFSCGLSWLDELDCDGQAESECISYDSISATREFLSAALAAIPDLQLEGSLEHSWPISPAETTVAEFSSRGAELLWSEHREAPSGWEEDFFPLPDEEDEDPDEIPYPTTPF